MTMQYNCVAGSTATDANCVAPFRPVVGPFVEPGTAGIQGQVYKTSDGRLWLKVSPDPNVTEAFITGAGATAGHYANIGRVNTVKSSVRGRLMIQNISASIVNVWVGVKGVDGSGNKVVPFKLPQYACMTLDAVNSNVWANSPGNTAMLVCAETLEPMAN